LHASTEASTEPISTNIRQADSPGPILFNLIMDNIISSVKEVKVGYVMENNNTQILCCDAMMLFAKSEHDHDQRLLHRFVNTAAKFNVLISTEEIDDQRTNKMQANGR